MAEVYLLSQDNIDFPPAELAPDEGLLAIGGDLSVERLINAYACGIFPWYSENEPLMWWSPNPRMVLFPGNFKPSKSLRRLAESSQFEVRFDTAFEQVIQACGKTTRKDQDGTWLTQELTEAFISLHKLGLAHSVETYYENTLVGGLYGLSLGRVFFGESMFYLRANASKVAFYHLVKYLQLHHFDLIDAQQDTNHLRSLGGLTIDRVDFIQRLNESVTRETLIGKWQSPYQKEAVILHKIV